MRRLGLRLVVIGLVMTLAGLSAPIYAGGYIGIDGASVSVDNSVDKDLNPRGLRLRLGKRIGYLLDIEAHFGTGRDSQSQNFERFRTSFAGVYLKAYLPVGERSAVYGLLGGAGVELTQQTVNQRNFGDGRSGLSYGIGLETEISRALDLTGDYIRYSLNDDEFSALDVVSVGLKWYF